MCAGSHRNPGTGDPRGRLFHNAPVALQEAACIGEAMKPPNAHSCARFLSSLLAVGVVMPVQAQLDDPRILAQFGSRLERISAQFNAQVYGQMQEQFGCSDLASQDHEHCTGNVFHVWENVRELVHTANELTGGNGPTTYSLKLDAEGLGFALRWTAAEEFAAQGAQAASFGRSQAGALSSRIAALRRGARMTRVARGLPERGILVASTELPVFEDSEAMLGVGTWSVYADHAFGYGRREDTTFGGGVEDAYDFDGRDVNLGVDYRASANWVFGAMGGVSRKRSDFDSSASIVDARLEADGFSVLGYALYEAESGYVAASAGMQWLEFDMTRRVIYPSFNPAVPAVHATAESDSDSVGYTLSLDAGYDWRHGAFTLGPYVKAQYQRIEIDGFEEGGASASGFQQSIRGQTLHPLETALGVRVQTVLTPAFGVVVPYARAQVHRTFDTGSRDIVAEYAALAPTADATARVAVRIPTEALDDTYGSVALGASLVLPQGWQGYAQYEQIVGLDDFDDQTLTVGVRYEY